VTPSLPHRADLVGVGVDIVDVGEIENSVAVLGERYLRRVYTERERASSRSAGTIGEGRGIKRLAACYAVKEATLKVLEPDDDDAVGWQSIDVQLGADTEHLVELHGAAAELAARRGIQRLVGSVEVSRGHAFAVVFGGGRPSDG
jgi:holo-[acyl-carrier protein] synthase